MEKKMTTFMILGLGFVTLFLAALVSGEEAPTR